MELVDSRRLTGPNILWRRPSAVIDVRVEPAEQTRFVRAWGENARRALDAVGWSGEELAHRRFHGGSSLALSAPIDALYAATEINEWAFEATVAELRGEEPPSLEAAAKRLRKAIAAERNPALLALHDAARERGAVFLWDDERVSVGAGKGSQTWPASDLPHPGEVDWGAVHAVPVALVTGTNGKTTTVRLLAEMARAAGLEPGISSTDGCWVAGEEIGEGDYSGPGGARLVLRDPRVEIAILETARGGMLRRGLGVERADVAIVTNVAEDHLGEWGIHDLDELVEAKMVVARGTDRLVLNADDPKLRERAGRLARRPIWFSLEPQAVPARVFLATSNEAAVLEGRELVHYRRRHKEAALRRPVARLDEVPIALGGAARHNVANALGAICVGVRLGLPLDAIAGGLRRFDVSAAANPGRLNRFALGGVDVIVDFAHNPDGLAALLHTARALAPKRWCVLVGQAGDRDDDALRELARRVAAADPDRVIVKELAKNLRGREPGEVPELLAGELRHCGLPEDAIEKAPSELAAVEQALRWARPGDLLLLLVHEERQPVLDLAARLEQTGWRPGKPLPATGS